MTEPTGSGVFGRCLSCNKLFYSEEEAKLHGNDRAHIYPCPEVINMPYQNSSKSFGHLFNMSGVEDKFDAMLRIQQEFQESNGLDIPVCDEASAIMCEGGELWAISGGKWWKKYIKDSDVRGRMKSDDAQVYLYMVEMNNRNKIIEESIDIWHFLMAVWIRLNLSPEEIFKRYKEKMEVNKNRQREGY